MPGLDRKMKIYFGKCEQKNKMHGTEFCYIYNIYSCLVIGLHHYYMFVEERSRPCPPDFDADFVTCPLEAGVLLNVLATK